MKAITGKTNQSDLYGQMSRDIDLLNISSLGRTVLEQVEKIVSNNRDNDTRLIKALKLYAMNLEILHR